jgi:serine/threonine-protein kinase
MNARELYEQHCARFASDDEVAWERLCAEHPQHAPELARLREEHIGWRALLRSLGTDQVQQRLTPASELESRSVGAALERMRARSRSDTRYKVQGEIGRGGMGVVLRVWDTEMGRTLAMKRIRGKESDGSAPAGKPATARLLARFLEEAQITGRLDHPGIVPVHEVGIAADGELYFTMRLVEGENLRTVFERVREGKEGWTITRALSVILRVCEAMSYAHHKGILHRDLKPSNIMVGRYGEAYVMDWGLARDLGDRDTHDLRWSEASEAQDNSADSLITRDGDIIGTPSYMSPEQALGETARIGPHSDVYSVGAMLYHLLSVDRISAPYTPRGSSPTARAVLQALRNAAPEPLVNAPAELIAITEKAMQRDIALRYPDMQALAADLRAYLEGQVVSAHATGALAEARKWVQRNRALTVALAGGLCALVGGLVFSLHFASESRANEQRVTLANISLDQRNQQLQTEARKASVRNRMIRPFSRACRHPARSGGCSAPPDWSRESALRMPPQR